MSLGSRLCTSKEIKGEIKSLWDDAAETFQTRKTSFGHPNAIEGVERIV